VCLGGFSATSANAQVVTSTEGKEVRVTLLDGRKVTGTFVSLSSDEVVIRPYGFATPTRAPLSEVQRVERVTHELAAGALIGLGAGIIAAVVDIRTHPYQDDGRIVSPLLKSGIYVGAGLAVGATIRSFTEDRRVLYTRSGSAVVVAPLLSPERAGIQIAMRW
jgi:hypothetical protein